MVLCASNRADWNDITASLREILCLHPGTRLVMETLGLDLEANSGDDQLMIILMVGAPEDFCVKQTGSKFLVNEYILNQVTSFDQSPLRYQVSRWMGLCWNQV